MGIHQDAFLGVITANSISSYTKDEINSVGIVDDDTGSTINLTPLSAACHGGHPDAVKLLLDNDALPNRDADKRTPFFFTINGAGDDKTQSRIITELIKGKADINLVCDKDGNTPLMAALTNRSSGEKIIRQLVSSGAAVDGPTNFQGNTARKLAERRGVVNLLDKQGDTSVMSKSRIVRVIAGLVETIVSYIKVHIPGNTIEVITNQASAMGGPTNFDNMVVAAALMEAPQLNIVDQLTSFAADYANTVDQLTSFAADYAKQKNLSAFFPKGSEKFFEELAKKAAALEDDPSTDLGKPENIKRLTILSLYEPVLYLDDSGSMCITDGGQTMTRFQILGELVKRIASIATKIVPDDIKGVELRFINSAYAERHDEVGVAEVVNRMYPRGGTKIGINLQQKVLEPIVYNKIAQKSDTNPIPMKRPVLVCIITDGEPNNEDPLEMQNEILRCRDRLRTAGYEDDAVMFSISQIGQADEATMFLNDLRQEARIRQTTHISTDRLDDMFQDMKENDRGLEVWLLKLLTKPFFE